MPHRRPFAALALAALATLGGVACDAAPTSSSPLRDGGERVSMTRLRAEPYALTFTSGLGAPARTVVRDEPLWRAAWAAIWSGQTPEPALPAVDFSREMVVVAALGGRSSGGYGIVVDSATVAAGTLRVHVRTSSPGPRCVVTAALTAPVDAVVVPRHEGSIEFRDRADVVRCD